MKVSVIIPSYNSKEFIEETLDSVLSQTYPSIEIVVVDDNSSDGSFELLANQNIENLILVKNRGKGACSARNYGFELSSGDYIQYLDADDILAPNKIELQMQLMQTFNDDCICSCGWQTFFSRIDVNNSNNQLIDKSYNESWRWLLGSWLGKGIGPVHNWLVPRAILDKVGYWNEDLLINQDGEFFSRVILEAKQIRFADKAMVYYRKGNPNSVSQSNTFSKEKSVSLLNSYILYKNTAIMYGKLDVLKKGLGQNYLTFIYQYYATCPELVKQAEQEFYKLGFNRMWPVGGENFKKLAKLLGFKNALKIKQLIRI